MKFFRKYIFPALYGLLQYFTVRLVHDIERLEAFWKRSWTLNIIEMACSIFAGYCMVYVFEKLFNFYDRKWPLQFSYRVITKELLITIGANLVVANAILTTMAATTDDGLSWADLVDVNTIPTLYGVIYYGVARSSTYLKAYVSNKIQLEKITNDHLQTELKFLKAQYHPHFLFNALNTIYFQMDEDVAGAKNSIEKFSELLRYQLYDQQQQVAVKSELEYLQSFIDLQKIRTTDRLNLQVDFDDTLSNQLVYPLLFLPLAENAFKFIGGDYKMMISARRQEQDIIFRVENSVLPFKTPAAKSGGIGLENLKRRLDLLYPGKHSFVTANGGDTFTAELKLQYE